MSDQALPVSVIIPCHECAESIDRALLSVERQSRLPRQVILVDDASADGGRTLERLQAFQRRAQGLIDEVVVIALPANVGPGEARNIGWERATEKFVAFLDADDAWHPDKLRLQCAWMLDHPQAVMTGHRTRLWDGREDPLPTGGLRAALQASPVSRRRLLLRNVLPTRSVMLRRELGLRFEPGMRRSEDYHLWLRIVLRGDRAWLLEMPLSYSFKADFGASGLSASLWKMEKGELETYSRLRSAGYYSALVWSGLCLWSWFRFLRRLALVRHRAAAAPDGGD